ncbi:MAG: metallophosphoesterase family protein [Chloroflexota bacterium]
MIDRSFLPPALVEFVVIADTHYMVDPGGQAVEFESRRRQTQRAGYALELAASIGAPFAIHLGDLVQEFPGSPNFVRAMAEAREQIRRTGMRVYQVAGNHELGDKPDPTMPVGPVTPGILARYQDGFGCSWYSFDEAGLHFVVLNAPLMNTGLPAEDDQRRWLEADLLQYRGRRIFAFLHYPPFLVDEHEPALGHYDNLDEPARGWLLSVLRQPGVELLIGAHTHFRFFNRIDRTRFFVAPSTSFTRPGFCEIFSSGPPDEHGRNDVAKLGFFLVRVHQDGARIHLVRTGGRSISADDANLERPILTGTPRDLTASPLGLTLRHPLARAGGVPAAWPSVVRQPMRDDYPLLACLELGARYLRVPATDLTDSLQARRLAIARDEGIAISATWLWPTVGVPFESIARYRPQLDDAEIQMPGALAPTDACLCLVARCATELDLPITLTPVIPGERVAGKQHPRTRVGFDLTELRPLNDLLARRGIRVARVVCRVAPNAHPWEVALAIRSLSPLSQIGGVELAVDVATTDPTAQDTRAAEAMFAMALLRGSRLFLEPLLDLDRTMDVGYGLLDRLENPRSSFQIVACLNTLLYGSSAQYQPVASPGLAGLRLLGVAKGANTSWLLLPTEATRTRLTIQPGGPVGQGSGIWCACLRRGTIRSLAVGAADPPTVIPSEDGPTLISVPAGQSVRFSSEHGTA